MEIDVRDDTDNSKTTIRFANDQYLRFNECGFINILDESTEEVVSIRKQDVDYLIKALQKSKSVFN